MLFQAGEKAYHGGDYNTAIARYSEVLERDSFISTPTCSAVSAIRSCVNTRPPSATSAPRSPVRATMSGPIPAGAVPTTNWNNTTRRCADFDRVLSWTRPTRGLQQPWLVLQRARGDMKAACRDWKESRKMGNAEAKIILSQPLQMTLKKSLLLLLLLTLAFLAGAQDQSYGDCVMRPPAAGGL